MASGKVMNRSDKRPLLSNGKPQRFENDNSNELDYEDRNAHTLDLTTTGLPHDDPAQLYLESLAPGSRRSQWSAVRQVVMILSGGEVATGCYPWATLTMKDVGRLRRELIETRAPATGRRYLSALRAVIEFAYLSGLMDHRRRDQLIHPRSLAPIRGSSRPPGRALDPDEAGTFILACEIDGTASAVRDAAVFAVLYCGGLRGRELINLDLADVDLDMGRILIHGKGAKRRLVVLSPDAVKLVKRWLEVRGAEPGPVFVPLMRSGSVSGLARVSYAALTRSIRRRAKRAGLARFTPHDLRRTFVTDLLGGGHRLEIVAHACGHANVNTTARYEVRKAAEADEMTSDRRLPSNLLGDSRG
jgi:integrase/recombinase XerD